MNKKNPVKKKKKSYHHGDLRQALIMAAVEIIAEREQAAFTLRELAKRLNVTHAATYHHFKDKEDLLAAVAEDGFNTLLDYLKRALACYAEDDTILKMRTIAATYIEFAVQNPAHFRVMYQRDYTKDPERFAATIQAYEAQRIFCEKYWFDALEQGIYRDDNSEEMHASSLSMLHGLAMLIINGLLEVPEDQTIAEYSSRISRHMFLGLASQLGREKTGAATILKTA